MTALIDEEKDYETALIINQLSRFNVLINQLRISRKNAEELQKEIIRLRRSRSSATETLPVVEASDVEKLKKENRRLQLDIEFLEKQVAEEDARTGNFDVDGQSFYGNLGWVGPAGRPSMPPTPNLSFDADAISRRWRRSSSGVPGVADMVGAARNDEDGVEEGVPRIVVSPPRDGLADGSRGATSTEPQKKKTTKKSYTHGWRRVVAARNASRGSAGVESAGVESAGVAAPGVDSANDTTDSVINNNNNNSSAESEFEVAVDRDSAVGRRDAASVTDPGLAGGEASEPSWACLACTFRNNQLMDQCEVCEMPRYLCQNPMWRPVSGQAD